jgi:RimJ/RimL family protein N-acetyltransferase
MRAVLADAFQRHALPEIVSFTAASNTRSQAVMARLGFVRDPTATSTTPGWRRSIRFALTWSTG